MNKDDWLKWHYENNGPFCVIKSGFSHALYMSVAIFIFSFLIGVGTYSSYEKMFVFSLITLFTSSVFLLFSVIPIILVHTIHYKIFKKILLENKLEKSVLVALVLIIIHFGLIYLSVDLIIFKLDITLPPIEFSFLSIAYILGLIKGFLTFQQDYYKTLNHDDTTKVIWNPNNNEQKKYF
jgi:hypothetical protein